MKSKFFGVLAAIVAVLFTATVSRAAGTYNPVTGFGFVESAEVRQAFGWDNAKLQANVKSVAFTYLERNKYSFRCAWAGGSRSHTMEETRSSNVIVTPQGQTRTSQVTGFNLQGYSSTNLGTEPAAICRRDDPSAVVTNLHVNTISQKLRASFDASSTVVWSGGAADQKRS
jgi:hypothetical protein